MLIELDEYDIKEILKSANLINCKKYEPKQIKDFKTFGDHTYIDVEDLLGWIENLNYALEDAQEKLEDMTNDLDSNYKPISQWEQSGMSYRDFI